MSSRRAIVVEPLAADASASGEVFGFEQQCDAMCSTALAHLIRYADDFVMVFSHDEDARRVLDVLPKRFGKYGLSLHPDKTRLVSFQRPSPQDTPATASDRVRPGSFALLGFTHFWGRSRRGFWVVKRKTAQDRLSRALTTIAQWCRLNRHQPLPAQHQTLSQKLRGHFAYFGITGNSCALSRFRGAVVHIWKKWLARRRRRGFLSWTVFDRLLRRYPLPPAVAIHSGCRSCRPSRDLTSRMP